MAEAPSGSLVGMVGAVPLGEIGILCHFAVHPAHRGRGLGTQLSRWAITYLRSQGVGVVRLESTPVAEKLYDTLGFGGWAGGCSTIGKPSQGSASG